MIHKLTISRGQAKFKSFKHESEQLAAFSRFKEDQLIANGECMRAIRKKKFPTAFNIYNVHLDCLKEK